MLQWLSARRKATANDSSSSKVHRREGQLFTVLIKPDISTSPRCTSAVSFFSCCDNVAALALENYNKHVAEAIISQPRPPKPSVLCTVPKAREDGVLKALNFPVRDTRARAACNSCFPCQTTARSFLRFSAPPRPFSPAYSPPPSCFFAQNCVHAGEPVR
jgi:hypothetical protein